MIVSVYNNIKHIEAPKHFGVGEVLSWVKSGRIKAKIDKLRATKNLEDNRKLKSELPSIVFAGKFSKREDQFCEELSGLAVLDFDHLINVEQKKAEMAKLPYVYAAFVSPNGDGLKVLVRIPKQFGRFSGYYRGLQKEHPELDPSNKNISRVCYLSVDENIYINENAIEFTNYIEEKINSNRIIQPNEIKIDDRNVIISNLFKWWNTKFTMTSGGRNHAIFVLACAFNEYGISEKEALDVCLQYAESDFTEAEIRTTVKSAYRKTSVHATKEFTTTEKLKSYLPKEISVDEGSETFYEKVFKSSFVDVHQKIEYPKPAISIGSHFVGDKKYLTSFGTYGNFSCIVGASKSKKTFLKSLLVSTYIGGKSNLFTTSIVGDNSQKIIVDIDTEQGLWHAQNVFKRVPKIVGYTPNNYKPFALRPYSHLERVQFIEYLIYESEYSNNIGLFVIDGLADLVADFNDLKETNLIIQKLMKWTDDKKFHLITVVHQNSTTTKATGHLGSSVLKKAETVCNLSNESEGVLVTFPFTRGFPINNFTFAINKEGLPYVVGEEGLPDLKAFENTIKPNYDWDIEEN